MYLRETMKFSSKLKKRPLLSAIVASVLLSVIILLFLIILDRLGTVIYHDMDTVKIECFEDDGGELSLSEIQNTIAWSE